MSITAEEINPIETPQQQAEYYLQLEGRYQNLLDVYHQTTTESGKADIAAVMSSVHMGMTIIAASAQLCIGGLYGQERVGIITNYDPLLHQGTQVHGEVEPGDQIRFLNSSVYSFGGEVIKHAQAVRVY